MSVILPKPAKCDFVIPEFMRSNRIDLAIATCSYCQSRCSNCVWPYMNQPNRVMSDQSFERILDRFKGFRFGELGLNVINEPFFDNSIINKIELLANRVEHIERLFFSSNWLQPNDKQLDAFCAAVLNCAAASHIDKIQLNATISGIDQRSYDILQAGVELTGATTLYRPLDFNRAVSNVCGVLDRLAKCGNSSKILFMLKAYGDLFTVDEMKSFWLQKFIEWNIPSDFAHHQIKILLNHGFTSFARGRAVVKASGPNFCRTAWLDKRLVIGPTGDVGLCCEDGLRQIIVGNLKRQNLDELIREKAFQENLKTVLGKSVAPLEHPCLRCVNY